MVVGTAVMGKPFPRRSQGDSLDGFEADLTDAVIRGSPGESTGRSPRLLRRATTRQVYDLFAYHRTKGQPNPQPASSMHWRARRTIPILYRQGD